MGRARGPGSVIVADATARAPRGSLRFRAALAALAALVVAGCTTVSPGEVSGPARPQPAAVATPADVGSVQGASAVSRSHNASELSAISGNAETLQSVGLSPQCRAARRVFVPRAAELDDSDRPDRDEMISLMESAAELAEGAVADDLEAARAFVQRQRRNARSITGLEEMAQTQRLDRLLRWAVETCPFYDAVWACSNPAPQAVGQAREKTGDAGALSARDALALRYGADLEEPFLLLDLPRRSVYIWMEEAFLVRWRVEVARVGEYWAIDRAAVCPAKLDAEALEAASRSVDVSGPDIVDGFISPERQARMDAGAEEARRNGPCTYRADDEEWDRLIDYVLSGQAEDACFDLYPPARAECLRGLEPGSSSAACPADGGSGRGDGSTTTTTTVAGTTTTTSRAQPAGAAGN